MLSKSAARNFFLLGTCLCSAAFIFLTVDTVRKVPTLTHEVALTPQAIRGKHLWERNNCMGCHTLLGEGAYYAPELTKVYERRGPEFIKAMMKDPQAMYPNARKMVNYHLNDQEIDDLVAFFKWIGEMDLQGWPPKPTLVQMAVPQTSQDSGSAVVKQMDRPKIFNQMCIACHTLQGQGGSVGPSLDGVGDRRNYDNLVAWLKDPQSVKPGAKMPKLPLSPTDVNELAAFLSQMKVGAQK